MISFLGSGPTEYIIIIAILQTISKSFSFYAFDSHPLLLLRKANKHFFQRNLLYLETGNLLRSHLGLQKRKYL
jgi:hypothetical protein